MDLSKRLVHVKSSTKEKDYPAFTPEDILFLFGDITRPEGFILNHSDPSECFVLFATTAPINNNEFYIASYPHDTISKMLYISMVMSG